MQGTQEILTGEDRAIEFCEGDWRVKTLEGKAELAQAYQLRHRVFAEQLQWVPRSSYEMEFDAYDAFATSVGLFDGSGALRGMFRMVNSAFPFMLESEFRACLLPTCQIRKASDTAEITRYAIDPTLTDKGLSNRLMQVLLKGVYQWASHNHIRYMYMVVEHRFLRALRAMGITCEAISPAVSLPPAGALSIAALLDWEQFRQVCPKKRPAYYQWMNAIDGSNPYERSTFMAMDPKERVSGEEYQPSEQSDQMLLAEDPLTLAAA